MTNPHNLLSEETSPYLLQHANNPVNWFPWSDDALARARTENRPILLSIGYSACHWCHVMAHESFEDDATADLMNSLFINIKVDREERPDLDKIYQTAHSLLTSKSGGWPLTVFLSPDNLIPFFAGTYFPKTQRYNMPAFSQIIQMAADAYINKKSEIEQQDKSLADVFKTISDHVPTDNALNSLPLDLARKQLSSLFDHKHGGFSSAPKFPHADMIERLMRHHLFLKQQNSADNTALHMALFTLDKMALGGFQDHLGGGFYRYSTDNEWMIPHFEKMLYDNAQLFALYAQAYTLTGKRNYLSTINHAANWVIREMQTEQGGYCSALDADTNSIEGQTYVWTPDELRALLTEEEYELLDNKFNLSEAANIEGKWHLHSRISNEELALSPNTSTETLEQQLDTLTCKLLHIRNKRSQPGRDDKILCSWNALMIRGMSLIGRRTQQPKYIDSAVRASEFIYHTLWNKQRLLASYKDGKAHLNAYLDDYAYLLQALIELLQARWNNQYYTWALQIADSLLEHFEDTEQGGFFFTSHDHETLLYRSKTFADDAMPNGNSVAAYTLQQLGLLSGKTRYLDAAERTLRCSYQSLNEQAITHCSLLHALELYLKPGITIILRGDDEALQTWQAIADQHYISNLTCFSISSAIDAPLELQDKIPLGEICAYICEGTTCLPAITDINNFTRYIKNIYPQEPT